MKTYGYGKQNINKDDIKAVIDVLKSPYLTCGPKVKEFEQAICDYTGAKYAVALNSATSALHVAMLAAGVSDNPALMSAPSIEGHYEASEHSFPSPGGVPKAEWSSSHGKMPKAGWSPSYGGVPKAKQFPSPGGVPKAGWSESNEVITTPITFLASANCARYCNAKVIFADIEPETANISADEIKKHITPRTKAIVPVHFAGQSCDMEAIQKIAKENNLFVIEDAAHAIGSEYKNTKVGSCKYSDMTVFSFHPVKTITTAEGGCVTTNSEELYKKLCAYRAHGMHKDGDMQNDWRYEMRELGYNYRMTDIQAALGISQLKRLEGFKKRRREIVDYYNKNLGLPHLIEKDFSNACFHLYPILVENRKSFYFKAREVGLNLQVHYIPVHLQPYYKQFGYKEGDYKNAEKYYEHCISLPLYPDLTNEDLDEIIKRIKGII